MLGWASLSGSIGTPERLASYSDAPSSATAASDRAVMQVLRPASRQPPGLVLCVRALRDDDLSAAREAAIRIGETFAVGRVPQLVAARDRPPLDLLRCAAAQDDPGRGSRRGRDRRAYRARPKLAAADDPLLDLPSKSAVRHDDLGADGRPCLQALAELSARHRA